MPQDIHELENRLKAILAKADSLLFHGDSDEEAPAPPVETPVAADIPVIPDIQPDTTLHLEGPPVFKLLPAAPDPIPIDNPLEETAASAPKIIPLSGTPPVLFLMSESAVVVPEPVPKPVPEPVREPIPAPAPVRVPGANEIPFLIGYPESQEKAAQELHERLERLEPKFTKSKFQLCGYGSIPYSRSNPLREAGFHALQRLGRGVLLLITTKKLNPKSVDALTAELSRHGLYFQVVPVDAISHKAFYFDFLLGLAFFLKSQKGDKTC